MKRKAPAPAIPTTPLDARAIDALCGDDGARRRGADIKLFLLTCVLAASTSGEANA